MLLDYHAYPQPGRPRLECFLGLLDQLIAVNKHQSPIRLVGREVPRLVGEHGCFAQAGRDAEENAIGSVGDFLLALLQEGDLSFEAASAISLLC
jgi:hypothetical protein